MAAVCAGVRQVEPIVVGDAQAWPLVSVFLELDIRAAGSMLPVTVSDATRILAAIQQGDSQVAVDLLPLVYEELRRLAADYLAQEPPGQTLQPTALVHEAWLRLTGSHEQRWNGRGHFFGAAAEAMRRILVENARRKQRDKHGGGLQRVDLTVLDVAATASDGQLLAVDEALERLAAVDPVGASLVKLRFFIGLPNTEAAQLLGLSERTAKRAWAYARAWLYKELMHNG